MRAVRVVFPPLVPADPGVRPVPAGPRVVTRRSHCSSYSCRDRPWVTSAETARRVFHGPFAARVERVNGPIFAIRCVVRATIRRSAANFRMDCPVSVIR